MEDHLTAAGMVAVVETNRYSVKWKITDIQYFMFTLKRASIRNDTLTLKSELLVMNNTRNKVEKDEIKYGLTTGYDSNTLVRQAETPVTQEELEYIFNFMIDHEATIRQKRLFKNNNKDESKRLVLLKEELINELKLLGGGNVFVNETLNIVKQKIKETILEEEFIPFSDEPIYLDEVIEPKRMVAREDMKDPVNHKPECSCNCWQDTILNP